MSDAVALDVDAPPRKGFVRRILPPLVLILASAGLGVAGTLLVPQFLPASPQPAQPKRPPAIAPLEYLEIDNIFTASLKDTGRYAQVRIAISTHGGKPVLEAVERHRMAIIAATLAVLSDSAEADLNGSGGRQQLAQRMRMAINDVLQRKSGIAGVDDVLLISFVIQ